MISVGEAERIIMAQAVDYGTVLVPFELAAGCILAEDMTADRNLPPCNRVTMDGIAIRYAAFEKGIRSYTIKATLAAGDKPVEIAHDDDCVEIMTGAALPGSVDTVVRYEDVHIKDGIGLIHTEQIRKGQNLHLKGRDKKQGDTVALAGQLIGPVLVSMAASLGKQSLLVQRLPRVVMISTGDELIPVDEEPTSYQVRRSNGYMVKAALQQYGVDADLLHLPDEAGLIRAKLYECLARYDVVLMSGGVSMGKFDHVPQVLDELGVVKLLHKVQQRPGKPFWFGRHGKGGPLAFAFPGNPVSTFLCLHRYFIPWLLQALKVKSRAVYATLGRDVDFAVPLQYFMQVAVQVNEHGQLVANPVEGNGSGDFANLVGSDAFMELPMEMNSFKKGEVYRIWPFKQIV